MKPLPLIAHGLAEEDLYDQFGRLKQRLSQLAGAPHDLPDCALPSKQQRQDERQEQLAVQTP